MSSLSHIPQVVKNRSTASRNANDENSGHGAPPKAETLAALSNDHDKSHSNLKRQRGHASYPQARPFQRTRTSEKTIPTEEANPLGEDCFNAILAFLPVGHLVTLRSLSKGTKVAVDEMVRERAQQPKRLDLKLKYYYNSQDVKKRIRVHPGWTETLRDRKAVIDFAVKKTGSLEYNYGVSEVNLAKRCLHKCGRASDEGMVDGAFVGYVRDVKWNDTLEVTTALKEVAGYFRGVENCNKSLVRGPAFFHSCDDEREKMVAEMNKEGQKILSAKETIMSLLLTNARNTVSFSKIDSKDESRGGDENWNEEGSTILVFRLSNELEIYLNSSFYEDQHCWDY